MNKIWLNAFGKMTYGIYVLTTRYGEIVNGMIASWVTQVSFDPPQILVAVHPNRYTHHLLEHSGIFSLHVIADSQQELLARFKGPDASKKFSGIDWKPGETGCPILLSSVAWFESRIKEHYQPGNHTLYVGEVVNAGCGIDETPLCTLDYEGMYTGRA